MNSVLIFLLLLIIIMFFITNSGNSERFVQVQNNSHSSYVPTIKPIQVTNNYNPPQTQSFRDDWISNPKNSPNIASHLINSSDDLPGTATRNFEDSEKKQSKDKSLISALNNKQNSKGIRPGSGHLFRPVELDSSPSSNTQSEKPYLTTPIPQSNTKYLDYGASSKILNQEIINYKNSELSSVEIAKKLIKKAAELALNAIQTNDSDLSVQNADYSLAYLEILQDLMSDSEIKSQVNIDLDKFTRELKKIQEHNTLDLEFLDISSDKNYLLDITSRL